MGYNNFDTKSFKFGKTKKRGLNWQLKDSDNDGVLNTNDCNPYNKNKQGALHTAGAWLARKAGKEETAGMLEQRGKESDDRKIEKEAYKENEQRDLAEYKRKQMNEAQQERQAKLTEEKKARIDAHAQSIANKPERAQQRKEQLKGYVKSAGKSIASGAQSMAKKQQSQNQGSNPFGGGMNFGGNNPMAEFSGGNSFGGGASPLAEFVPGKKKKASGMGFNPMAEFIPKQSMPKKRTKKRVVKNKNKSFVMVNGNKYIKKVTKRKVKRTAKKKVKSFVVVNGKKYWRK